MLDVVLAAVTMWLAGIVYLLPSLVAARRKPHLLPRLLLRNALLGWTVIVWFACLWVALIPRRRLPGSARRDQAPDWLRAIPRDERGWHALPVATAPLFEGRRR